jgi:hypothetical protein
MDQQSQNRLPEPVALAKHVGGKDADERGKQKT